MSSTNKPFRLLDLPGEIRTRIYEEVLFSFATTPTDPVLNMLRVQSRAVKVPENTCESSQSINTAILRTSKQVYREAYDVMMKKNQFVHINTTGIPMETFLASSQIPIIHIERASKELAEKCLMSLFMRLEDPGALHTGIWQTPFRRDTGTDERAFEDFAFLVRSRDWHAFCTMLDHTDIFERNFRTHVGVTLTLTPYEPMESDLKAPMSREFHTSAQESLLTTFRSQIHEVSIIKIQGLPAELAKEIEWEMGEMQWNDPQDILSEIRRNIELGQQQRAEGHHIEACETWMRIVSNIQRMRFRRTWGILSRKDGSFLEHLAEILTTLLHEKVQCIYEYQRKNRHVPLPKYVYTALEMMTPIRKGEYFDLLMFPNLLAEEEQYPDPEMNDTAKSYHRRVALWRDMDDPMTVEFALHSIQVAVEYAPANAMFQEEKGRTLAWIKEMNAKYLEPWD